MSDELTLITDILVTKDKNGNVVLPRELDCPHCGFTMRRKPGNRYTCAQCGGVTTSLEGQE